MENICVGFMRVYKKAKLMLMLFLSLLFLVGV